MEQLSTSVRVVSCAMDRHRDAVIPQGNGLEARLFATVSYNTMSGLMASTLISKCINSTLCHGIIMIHSLFRKICKLADPHYFCFPLQLNLRQCRAVGWSRLKKEQSTSLPQHLAQQPPTPACWDTCYWAEIQKDDVWIMGRGVVPNPHVLVGVCMCV